MAAPLTITLRIPDINAVVRDGEDVQVWVQTALSKAIAERLKALKTLNAKLEKIEKQYAIIIPETDRRGFIIPDTDLRGITIPDFDLRGIIIPETDLRGVSITISMK